MRFDCSVDVIQLSTAQPPPSEPSAARYVPELGIPRLRIREFSDRQVEIVANMAPRFHHPGHVDPLCALDRWRVERVVSVGEDEAGVPTEELVLEEVYSTMFWLDEATGEFRMHNFETILHYFVYIGASSSQTGWQYVPGDAGDYLIEIVIRLRTTPNFPPELLEPPEDIHVDILDCFSSTPTVNTTNITVGNYTIFTFFPPIPCPPPQVIVYGLPEVYDVNED